MKSDWEGDLANMELKQHSTSTQCLRDIGHTLENLNCKDNETVLNLANEMSVIAARSELSKCLHEICHFTAIFHKILYYLILYYLMPRTMESQLVKM